MKIDEGTLLPGRCRVSGFAGLRMISCVSRNVLDSEMHLRCVAGWRLMNGSMSLSPRVRCMWRRRGARTISSSRCSSSAQGGRFSACSTRF